jgi:hypothetical protein
LAEARVPGDHPLRPLIVDKVLRRARTSSNRVDVWLGRPSIAPEKPLRALVLQQPYTIRSARLLVEPLQHNLPFQWFVWVVVGRRRRGCADLRAEPRPVALTGDIAAAFLRAVLAIPDEAGLQ